MLLIELTREQIKERFDSLPENLQKAYLSPGISEEVWRISQLNHLSREKTAMLAKIVGRVFLGFIDMDDMAAAIRDNIGLPPELAGSLAREIKRKIFAFYEADILRVYAPAEELTEDEREAEREIVPREKPATPIKITPREEQEEPKIIPPARITDKSPVPTPAPLPKQISPAPSLVTPREPAPSAGALTPAAPFILHKEEKVAPLAEKRSIREFEARVEISAPKETKPLVSAELELGEEIPAIGTKKEAPIAKTPVSAPRTVHYSDLRTPVSPFESRGVPPPSMPPAQARPTAPVEPIQPKPVKIGTEEKNLPPAPLAKSLSPTPPGEPIAPIETERSRTILPQSPELWPKAAPEPRSEARITPSAPPQPPIPPRITPVPHVKIEGNTVDLRNTNSK